MEQLSPNHRAFREGRDSPSPTEGPTVARAHKVLLFLGESLLSLAAIGGLLCIIALIVGSFFNVSLIVFRTGSMEPNYPVGAISLAHEVPATSLKEGDVVSVVRENSTVLITHRVVQVTPLPDMPEKAELILKGDANTSMDPLPYNVSTAKKIVFTVPGVGQWIMALRGPWFIGGTTVLLTILVTWAFWPKKRRARQGAEQHKTVSTSQGRTS